MFRLKNAIRHSKKWPMTNSNSIPGLEFYQTKRHKDNRGWFEEVWSHSTMAREGIDLQPKQFNVSGNLSSGVIRGMHAEPWNKLITVLTGRAFCAWVDLRKGPSLGKSYQRILEPGMAVLVPAGVANGYQTLESDTVYGYLVDDVWVAGRSYTAFNPMDKALPFSWPITPSATLLSEKDSRSARLEEVLARAHPRKVIFGSSGQLGRRLLSASPESHAPSREDIYRLLECDFDPSFAETTIVNAAAYTDVNKADTPLGFKSALEANYLLPERLIRFAERHNSTLIHISSDFVFGNLTVKQRRRTSDSTLPVNMYGASKLLGELAIKNSPRAVIVRVGWLLSEDSGFVKTVFNRARLGLTSEVVEDQFGSPTLVEDLASWIDSAYRQGVKPGTYHFRSNGQDASWYEIAKEIYSAVGTSTRLVIPIGSNEYQAKNPETVQRPNFSALELQLPSELPWKASNPDWKFGLRRIIKKLLDGDGR